MKKLVCILGVASLLAVGITGCGDDNKNSKKSCDDAQKPAASCTCNTTTGAWENCGTTPIQCNEAQKPASNCACNTTTGTWVCGNTPIQCNEAQKTSPACTCNTTTGTWENCGGTTEACDESSFEEKCDSDGHTILYCYKGAVEKFDCQDDYDENYELIKNPNMICAKSTSETENFVECLSNEAEDKCDTVHATEDVCGYDPLYELFEMKYTLSCMQFDNGEKYWYPISAKYCSNRCSDGCTVQTCEANSAPSCPSEGLSLNCMEDDEGNWQILAEDCESYTDDTYTCQIEDGIAECL